MVRDELISDYLTDLGSSSPAPGGGGASAIVAAFGCSLGQMVCNLTIGKKKYAAYEEELKEYASRLESLKESFYALADKDEEVFLPLAKGYKMPHETEEEIRVRDAYMEQALYEASLVPLQVLELSLDALRIIKELSVKGSVLSVSDAGCGAACLESAMKSAILNVKINEKSMKKEDVKKRLHEKSEFYLAEGIRLAGEARENVVRRIS